MSYNKTPHYTFLFLIIFFSTFKSYAQFTVEETKIINAVMLTKVNGLRVSEGRQKLELDENLTAAAQLHTDYMSERDKLTHDEDIAGRESPSDRVRFIGATHFVAVGENVLVSKPQRFPLSETRLRVLAKQMYSIWYHSSGHYKNMVTPKYEKVGFAYTIHKASGRVYAAQVFGTLGHEVKGQLSKNDFSLKRNEVAECENVLASIPANEFINMGNQVHSNEATYYFYEHNIQSLKNIFENENDGLYVDILERSQYPCKAKNLLDLSGIHDGVMLKPVYRDELFNNDISKSTYRLITSLGDIPEQFKGKDIYAKIGIIKNGKVCKIITPNPISSSRYRLKEVEPKLIQPLTSPLTSEGIIASHEINFEFDKNSSDASPNSSLTDYNLAINRIEIFSFTSIDGNEQINKKLYQQRAEFMKRWILQKTSVGENKISITSKENWQQFYFQLKMLDEHDHLEDSKSNLRALVKEENDIPWDSFLHQQRRSKIIIHEQGNIPLDDSLEYYKLNVRQAIQSKNYDKANLALYELCKMKGNAEILFEPSILNALMNRKELVQNATGLMLINNVEQLYETTAYISYWLTKTEELPEEALFNLTQLYAKTTLVLLETWDVYAERLGKVLHPRYVEQIAEKIEGGQLLLNFHLSTIYYYGQINDYPNIGKAFDFIADYFMERKLNIEDELKLCLFYNHWSRYDLTLNLLMDREYEKKPMNEEAAFILVKTAYGARDLSAEILNMGLLLRYNRLAYKYNKKRWCEMVNTHFYMLEDKGIKKMYCSKCVH